jgi:hypothetical protein
VAEGNVCLSFGVVIGVESRDDVVGMFVFVDMYLMVLGVEVG